MNGQIKNSLFQSRPKFFWFLIFFLAVAPFFGQVANYIANGSFERLYDCNPAYDLLKVKGWSSTDSSLSVSGGHFSLCNNNIPLNGNTYQFPRTGETLVIATTYYPSGGRGYLRNRLKQTLNAGKTYCVKFHTNICNTSTYGMDGFGIFFDASIDTITKCNIPLTYITPQISNPPGNIITDTLNWVAITGTFTANGTEKFALIGNFMSNAALTTSLINSTNMPLVFTDAVFDDVSCIDIDLPAYAGRDTSVVSGNTVYIGRPRDVGIDEACTWYQLPNTSSVIATAAGLTVNAIGSATYMVRQEICGNVKWDTVVVKEDPLGIGDLKGGEPAFRISPNPAADQLSIHTALSDQMLTLTISDLSGRVLLHRELQPEGNFAILDLSLPCGAYLLRIGNQRNEQTVQKLIIAK